MNKCPRCGKEAPMTIMSMFNDERVCVECKECEKRHSRYGEAEAAERASVARGEREFKGIGYPPELYEKEQ